MAYNQELLAKTPIIRFKEQNFYSLRDHCLKRGLLFEDETFPAETYSIGLPLLKGRNLSNLTWMRPKDLLKGKSEPHFILEGASRFDIRQGEAGDCWFLAALGSLTQNPQHLQRILADQSFSHQYAGIFRFRFWQCGQWVEVVIDDRLPVLNEEYLFVEPCNKQEFWPCLLEKAYAKFHGSYVNLHYGYLPDALMDLSGGVVTNISPHVSSPDLVMMVKKAAEAGSLMTCGTLAGPMSESTRMANGLVSRHAYTVTGAEQVWYRRSWEYLIRLWNPWGKVEWRGPWSDGSPEWQEIYHQQKSQLYEHKDDGEFWMSCRDFQENFSCLFICNQVPISLDHGNMPHERWSQMTFKNHVIPGNTAEFQRDVQYLFSVPDSMESSNVVVSFNIMPQNLKAKDKMFPLNFEVFKVDSQVWPPPPSLASYCPICRWCSRLLQHPWPGRVSRCSLAANSVLLSPVIDTHLEPPNRPVMEFQHFRERLPPTFFSKFRMAEKGIVSQTPRNLTECFSLSPGTYVVVVSAGREAAEFSLRIFLKMSDSDRDLGNNLNLRPLKIQATLPEDSSQQSIFYKYSQQGPDIDAAQLQSLLNQEFLKGPPGDTFSLDQCRSIVALMDLKVNGRLDQEEFSRLWIRLAHCQSVFQNTQKNSRVFLSSDLWKAINDTDFLAGVSVSNELLGLMSLRYSDSSGRVTFPSLVCLLMRLEAMTKAFHNLSKDGRGLYLTKMEWMNLVMYN
ncbi:calpain-13 [Camelus dromedarius]|uniref:calpain-13 n=1 Tax=Camelus dromedarius TaxID=9838 RepID=UPI0031199595